MADRAVTDLTDALDDYLERERAALLAGDLELLARLSTEKEALVAELAERSDVPRVVLDSLQSKLVGNQALFDSALAGIRAVAQRLGTMRRVRRDLETYTKDGHRALVRQSQPQKLERKA